MSGELQSLEAGAAKVGRARLVAGGIVAAIVVALVIAHCADNRRGDTLTRLHGQIDRDSAARVAATAKTDTALVQLKTATAAIARADSGWTVATRAADRVPVILAAPVPDTVKIRELVYVVDTLRERGDSLERTVVADTVAVAVLYTQLRGERAAWQLERNNVGKALETSEAQHRHWGLGATLGPTITRESGGTVRANLIGLTVGITYRW
jgi:hypothetical protein